MNMNMNMNMNMTMNVNMTDQVPAAADRLDAAACNHTCPACNRMSPAGLSPYLPGAPDRHDATAGQGRGAGAAAVRSAHPRRTGAAVPYTL